jgi:hypothetical protein
MLLGAPGLREISPALSRLSIIWWTDGGVTRKNRIMSASAGGRPFTSVWAWMPRGTQPTTSFCIAARWNSSRR